MKKQSMISWAWSERSKCTLTYSHDNKPVNQKENIKAIPFLEWSSSSWCLPDRSQWAVDPTSLLKQLGQQGAGSSACWRSFGQHHCTWGTVHAGNRIAVHVVCCTHLCIHMNLSNDTVEVHCWVVSLIRKESNHSRETFNCTRLFDP